jgi:anti-sigma regulatory factor (Ser/Thr protein kinase)
VQATAYRLATEQAQLRRSSGESLADLARRSQNLLRRQLGFITRLEGEETDPTGLANLFELDHLATRMRRNAESLLVLVGAASPRTWSAPLPVSDVIRAAVAEVEEYRRVTLRRVDDALLSGAVVSGVAHMLAELVENGLSFSAPDVDVEIQGRLLGDHYLIAVVDQGVGMDADELAEANRRLRGEGDFLVAPTRFLGHYVAGRLARDLGVGVELTPSPVTGLTARLLIPAELLALPPSLEAAAAEPDVEVLEPASALMADGRLRPVTVEYVTAPPFLPMQREAADDWLLREAADDWPLREAADGRLLGAPTDSGADGSRPGADSNGHPLGAATDGGRLSAITDGHQAGAATDGRRLSATTDGHQAGPATDGRRLSATTDGHQAGPATDGRRLSATTDGQQPGAASDMPDAATEGRRLSAATDGRVPSASTGGRTPNGLPRRPPRTQRQQVHSARSTDKDQKSEMSERVDEVRGFASEAADAHTPEHDAAAVWGSEHQAAGMWGTQHQAAGPWLHGDETSDAWEPERETAGVWRPEHEARSHSAGHNGREQHAGHNGREQHAGHDGREQHAGHDGREQHAGQDGLGQPTGHDARAHRAEHDAAAEPEEVRARLDAFRAGVHRGNS